MSRRSRPQGSSSGTCWLLSTLVLVLAACASLPNVPAGPVRSPGVRFGVTYAYAYGPARATLTDPSGGLLTTRGNGQLYGGVLPIFPQRAMVRVSPAKLIDLGADIGWVGSGLQLRGGRLDAAAPLPWAVELEWRTGQNALLRDELLRQTYVYRARAELYPPLGRLGELDTFGVLSLGLSTGLWLHALNVPSELDVNQNEGGFGPPALHVLRPETRLELSLGAHGLAPGRAATLALMPWFAIDRQRVRDSECAGCVAEYGSFDAAWGIALAVSGSFVIELE